MAGKGKNTKGRGEKVQREPRVVNEAPREEYDVVNSVEKSVSERPEASARTGSSTASAVVIARLRDQVRAHAEMLRAAGLQGTLSRSERVPTESEGESKAPVVSEPRNRVMIQEREGETFKTFMSCKPPTFKGGEDPLECIRWVRKMEQVHESGNFLEKQKVRYAIRMLEGEALDWWDTVNQTLSAENKELLTWVRFVDKLRTRFCSSGAVQRMEREFTHLVKGDMSIAKYNITFYDKLQFCRYLCPTESRLVSRYAEGLPVPYRGHVRSKSTIEEAMEEARRVEDDLALPEKTPGVGEKRKTDGVADSAHREFRRDNGKQKKQDANFCRTCQKSHQGRCDKADIKCHKCGLKGHYANECKEKNVVCYNCSESGHIATKCTKPRMATARAYNMTAGDLLQD